MLSNLAQLVELTHLEPEKVTQDAEHLARVQTVRVQVHTDVKPANFCRSSFTKHQLHHCDHVSLSLEESRHDNRGLSVRIIDLGNCQERPSPKQALEGVVSFFGTPDYAGRDAICWRYPGHGDDLESLAYR